MEFFFHEKVIMGIMILFVIICVAIRLFRKPLCEKVAKEQSIASRDALDYLALIHDGKPPEEPLNYIQGRVKNDTIHNTRG